VLETISSQMKSSELVKWKKYFYLLSLAIFISTCANPYQCTCFDQRQLSESSSELGSEMFVENEELMDMVTMIMIVKCIDDDDINVHRG
jgi:hypothetical protein